MDLESGSQEINVEAVDYIPKSRYDALTYRLSELDEEYDLTEVGLYLGIGVAAGFGLTELERRYLG